MDAHPAARGVHRLIIGHTSQIRCGVQVFHRRTVQDNFTIAQYATVWLISGGAELHCGERHVPVRPGDAFHRFPTVPHDVTFVAGTAIYYLALPAECQKLLHATGIPALADLTIHLGLDRELRRRWDRRIDGLAHSSTQRLADELLALCGLCVDIHRRAATAPGRYDRLLDRACELLTAQLHQRISIPVVAKQVGLTYATFRSVFTKRFGVSPGDWRIQRRLERAQELLLTSDSIDSIAHDLGYPHRDAFTVDFKRHCGEPPGRWRTSSR